MTLSFAKNANTMMTGKRYEFSASEKAAGQHCVEEFQQWPYAMTTALKERLGNQVDDRISVGSIEVLPSPVGIDGMHKLTVLYQVNRIGEQVTPTRKAIGTLKNADCTFTLTVFQR